MIAVVQRIRRSTVYVNQQPFADTGEGMLALVGVAKGDTEEDALKLGRKALKMRIFADDAGKMNLDILQAGGEAMIVPNFTLAADAYSGNRPSFDTSETPEKAKELFYKFVSAFQDAGVSVMTGEFGGNMDVVLMNDGPVTFVLDSKKL